MINERCRKEGLKLGDTDVIMNELFECRLYQLHKAAKMKSMRLKNQTRNGSYKQPRSNCKANCYAQQLPSLPKSLKSPLHRKLKRSIIGLI